MVNHWITQKGSSAHPRRNWTERDLLHGTPIQHFSRAVGPSAQRGIQPGDGILIYWPGAGNQLFMGTFEAAGPVEFHAELPEGWPYAVPLRPRHVIRDRRDGLPLEEAMTIGGERIRRFARGACARGLYRINAETFARIEEALAPRAFAGEFQELAGIFPTAGASEEERETSDMTRALDIRIEIPDDVSEEVRCPAAPGIHDA